MRASRRRVCGAVLVWVLLPGLVTAGPASADVPGPAYGVRLTEGWIPLPDGTRLAADLYLPTGGADNERYPVLLEYLPYRKHEQRSSRYPLFEYFVRRGYVVARVDIRGTGASEGRLIAYEYTEQEQQDGEVVIDWLARQPWSTGRIGMLGLSWGGFNAIHMAMRRPPALKAILAIQAADDLYEDDVHFTDGIMHADAYEMNMDVANAVPAAPGYVIDERYFAERFDTEPWFLLYKREQRDGPFWDRASLNVRYDAIEIPTFVIGGWYDGYRDSVPRMLENLAAPVKAIVGPWAHEFPNWGFPGEPIEWRREAVRWFDQWLRGVDTGILAEPAFAVYVRDWHPPGLDVKTIPGRWRYEQGWPLERGQARVLYLDPAQRLAEEPPAPAEQALTYRADVGVEAGGSVMWWGDLQEDQRPVDAWSLVYDSAPLESDLEILGFPRVHLNASADAPLAHWIARLCDVAPDGRVTLITGAALNGAHRRSASAPEALVPGREYPLDIELHFTSWVFPKGHRIRLAVNNAQWPMFWPVPGLGRTALRLGGEQPGRLTLPVVPPAARPAPVFAEPEQNASLPGFGEAESETVSGYAEISRLDRDIRNGVTRLTATNSGRTPYPWGTESYGESIVHEVNTRDPAQAKVTSDYWIEVELPDRTLKWQGLLDFSSDDRFFYYQYTRLLLEDGAEIRRKRWDERIPRDHQ